ncbi:DUF5110 domain-containing protein [Oerskovia sp. M15]
MFVRAGAVIPQGMVARNASLVPEDSAITLDVYPQGDETFSLYEDDKLTRAYKQDATSSQELTVSAPEQDGGDVTVTIGERDGDYAGKAAARPYLLDVHTGSAPSGVTVGERRSRRSPTPQPSRLRRRAGSTTRPHRAASCASSSVRSPPTPRRRSSSRGPARSAARTPTRAARR